MTPLPATPAQVSAESPVAHVLPLALTRDDIFHLVKALLADELGALQKKSISPIQQMSWQAETLLDETGIGFDSLGLLDAAGRINQFFHLHESGIEDYLLVKRDLGGWVEVVEAGLSRAFSALTFQTSGSAGVPKTCTHAIATLIAELTEVSYLLDNPKRIFTLVPPHHIYGFLFSIALPRYLDVPVLDVRTFSPAKLVATLQAGDLVVATPFIWRYLAGSCPDFPDGVHGLTSTAPMPADLAEQLSAKNLGRLTEIYGSSETAGIGWRQHWQEPFTLFSCHAFDQARLVRTVAGATYRYSLPDRLDFIDKRRFFVTGRHDGAVQVGGINVFPDRIAQLIATHGDVAECAVRPLTPACADAASRLKAFIVPRDGVDVALLETDLRRFIAASLTDVERPVCLTFGAVLPRNPMGKIIDWPVKASVSASG